MKFDKLVRRYSGATAKAYDDVRRSEPKWRREQEVMEGFLRELPSGATLLDVPIGTGRFIEFYHRYQLAVTGTDISNDMLVEARRKADALALEMDLRVGDVLKLEADNGTFDVTLCIRLMNWLSPEHVSKALSELARVSRRFVIVGIRTWSMRSDRRETPARSVAALLLGPFARARKRLRGNRLVIHDAHGIQNLIKSLDLQVRKRELIEHGLDGTSYYFYLLDKRQG